MAPRYERVNGDDDEDSIASPMTPTAPAGHAPTQQIPSSPPPSFHSRPNSPGPNNNALGDAFDSPDSDDEEEHDMRNIRNRRTANGYEFLQESIPLVRSAAPAASSRPAAPAASARVVGGNDGVFSNLNAKPEVGRDLGEEAPPSYEQAAADAAPAYWETTILAPGMSPDEIYIEGLPVGSFFAFVWNAMISMSFQLVGFLLTYLLHTTHAAKNGSRAGLGVTLIQYGFYMRSRPEDAPSGGGPPSDTVPSDANSIDFKVPDVTTSSGADTIGKTEWVSYILMIVGWFILIRAVSDFIRARRTESLILASPERAATTVVVEEESQTRAV